MTSAQFWLLVGFAFIYNFGAAETKRVFKCPSGCSCSKETIICVGSSQIPRTIPNEINSLWVSTPFLWLKWLFRKSQYNKCRIHRRNVIVIPCFSCRINTCGWIWFVRLSQQEHGKWIYCRNYRRNVFTYAFSSAAVSAIPHVKLSLIY